MRPDDTRFFDGETMQPGSQIEVLLGRVVEDGRELFTLRRRIAYQDRHHPAPHVVPADPVRFRTDLASVPAMFTWLVPKTGCHLPAALVHDGLVSDPDDPENASYLGPRVDRREADRIFRDAMGDLGTGAIRRWLVWTAVSLATVKEGVAPVWYHRLAVFGSLALIAVMGVIATLDLLDVADVIPWMADRSLGVELATGAAGAIVIPVVLSATWLGFWKAGIIAGVALALLLHVTAVIAALTGVYIAAEWIARRLGWH